MNKQKCNYSVTIRTLGMAGEKYQQTLHSIASQSIQPQEVIIVLPEGYPVPSEKLGYERIIYSSKGMVSQRVTGFEACHSEYLLALDDDVEFDSDFVEQLFNTMEETGAQFVSPIVQAANSQHNQNMGGGKRLHLKHIIDWLMGCTIRRKLNECLMVKVWRTGGFIVNTNIQSGKQYYNQSGHGTCIFGRAEAVRAIHFEDELWLQDTRYAIPDDMLFFYKLYLNGNKIAMNRETRFVHLDAGTTLMNEDKLVANVHSYARNGFIFWHRFIYTTQDKKWLSVLCMARKIFFTSLFAFMQGVIKRDMTKCKTYIKAYLEGFKYIHSDKYKRLKKVISKV